jgi:hypothetical protein
MKTNGQHPRPDEILADIDRTRDEMDRTLAAIEQRLTPGQLVDQGMDYLRHSGANEFVQNLGGAAKQNPMPVALTAIGLAWLMALGRQPAQGNGSSATSASGLRKSMHDMGHSLGSAKDRISGGMDAAREQWQRARGGMDYLVNEQPLALGALGLALGAILGAAAPRTRMEEQALGQASRNLTEKAKEMGSQQLDKATQAAKQMAEEKLGQSQKKQESSQSSKPESRPSSQPEKKGGW